MQSEGYLQRPTLVQFVASYCETRYLGRWEGYLGHLFFHFRLSNFSHEILIFFFSQ
jgi:hypothetical protein